jgi:Fe-S cluster biogenesis protein NfuA
MAVENKQVLLDRVEKVLTELRPHLWADEGDVRIVDLDEDNVLILKWLGACTTCKLSNLTLNYGIKLAVLEQVDEIRDVVIAE